MLYTCSDMEIKKNSWEEQAASLEKMSIEIKRTKKPRRDRAKEAAEFMRKKKGKAAEKFDDQVETKEIPLPEQEEQTSTKAPTVEVKTERADEFERRFFIGVYSNRNKRPEISHFVGLRESLREDDEKKARAQKARYEKKDRKSSHRKDGVLLENFLRFETENADWFEGSVFKTTEHDDLFNGVDAVIEWPGEIDSTLLAVDYTGTTDKSEIARKMRMANGGARVDYFETDFPNDDDNSFSSKQNIPKVVLGVDSSFLNDVIDQAFNNRMGTGKKITTKLGKRREIRTVSKKAFAEHPLKYLMLEQAEFQLRNQVFRDMARVSKKFGKTEAMDGIRSLARARDKDGCIESFVDLFESFKSMSGELAKNVLGDTGAELLSRRLAAWS